MSSSVVTRFAPSPTGYLHIGGARTALFNWLYAKHTGGRMLLRIEDTDRERSSEAAVTAILDGLKWLGLDWDGDAVSQYERAPRHREVAEELVTRGKAYYCYASQAELEEMREKARSEGRPPRYDGRWRDRDPKEAPEGIKPVIRIKAPQTGETLVRDQVQGDVRFPNKDLDDFIILRSDGNPTYMHAVVVDDHDMEVTHIIRGDDHLTNAARQTVIYDALGCAGHGSYSAHSWCRRRKIVEAAWCAWGGGLSRHGLPASSATQLSRSSRLESWRRRDYVRRTDDPMV
jgi:glutamyl-tRNA synthetase